MSLEFDHEIDNLSGYARALARVQKRAERQTTVEQHLLGVWHQLLNGDRVTASNPKTGRVMHLRTQVYITRRFERDEPTLHCLFVAADEPHPTAWLINTAELDPAMSVEAMANHAVALPLRDTISNQQRTVVRFIDFLQQHPDMPYDWHAQIERDGRVDLVPNPEYL